MGARTAHERGGEAALGNGRDGGAPGGGESEALEGHGGRNWL